MYKIKFSTTNMKVDGKKIKKAHCADVLENIKIESYGFVKECIFLYKHRNNFTHKLLELFCNKDISEKALRKMIRKIKECGVTGEGTVELIDVKSNQVLCCYDYECISKEEATQRTRKYKNTSDYITHRLYKR